MVTLGAIRQNSDENFSFIFESLGTNEERLRHWKIAVHAEPSRSIERVFQQIAIDK
jgi:hypothetical protein